MKKIKFFSTLLLASIFFYSCSSSDDSEPIPLPTPVPTENVWKLDNFNYTRRVSNQTSISQGKFTIVNIDSNIASSNDPFTTCNLILTFSTVASTYGDYTVKTQNTLFLNENMKYVHVKCQIASGSGTGAIYESTDSAVLVNISKVNGVFIADIPNTVTLTRTYNDGMINPPNTVNLTAQKVQ